ncbi:MAG: iron-containing alcohol dehydrogenase [Proteobacteria bacterium]|nr:iron-containing alcohol dehydrogenase [Pseudomonadota bacterium]
MSCRHLAAIASGLGETAFTVDASRVTFGRGALAEVGDRARALGMRRVALITDRRVRALPWFAEVAHALAAAAIDVAIFDEVAIEPTELAFDAAARFAREARVDGYVSLGGGSVIDTCKAANLFATYPAALRTYVNAPVGDGLPIPGPLAPHLACPTTSGTGSEVTGIAIFDWTTLHAKTGIASPRLRPTEAIVDPRTTSTLPGEVVAASGLDVLCHALESFTARAYTTRAAATPPTSRPASQGANPWSDLGCREAMRLAGSYLVRAVRDATDAEAREQIMWAATLAGIAFGNAGVHAPHAMAYAIAGRVRDYRPTGYPDAPLVPHGMAVALGAPAVFRAFGRFRDDRHLEAATLLGADTRGAAVADGGELLATRVVELMRAVAMPNGLAGVGYGAPDLDALVDGTLPQRRLLANAPCEVDAACARALFASAMVYW